MPGTDTTPLELLGASAGLSVVDPTTILTRLWFFDGKFLRAAGLRLDQDYVRSLAALSHQATGSGIVHGFGVTRPAAGDRLLIGAGLALAPSGRVVYLPREVDVSVADLIARSAGASDPGSQPAPEAGDFRRCPPDAAAGPDVTVDARPLYVLSVAGMEVLCGEEERFGQLCVDACATETDRSTVVEGVVFRVRELTLALPTSTAVPFDGRHLRSRVASAYFQAERAAVPAMISGAGLGAPVWCAGADPIGGEEVPLAVLDRSGGVTVLMDTWTARRELQETTPRRYWAARMAMRPWDVFLAQVLQFQCQLLDLGAPGSGGGGGPCQTERDALTAADTVLGGLPPDQAGRVEAVRAIIAAALGAEPAPVTRSGSLLVDGGIVELPSAGYLPTSLSRPVQDQVRALFGPGVDLRFCAVRPDYIPEALQEAQHMERISLTRGIDDPARLEEVDVLVPDGKVVETAAEAAVFTGVARLFPVRRPQEGDPGSVLSFSVVARDRSATGWSWTAVGYGEAPQQLTMSRLVAAALRAFGVAFGVRNEAEGSDDEELPLRPDVEHDRIRQSPAFTRRLVAEGSAALRRRTDVLAGAAAPAADQAAADDAVRSAAFWLDGETGVGLDTLAVGASTNVQVRATTYSRANSTTALSDIRLTGAIRVVDVLAVGDQKTVRVVFDGVSEVISTSAADPKITPVRAFPLSFGFAPQQRRLVVSAGNPVAVIASLAESSAPRHIVGDLVLGSRNRVAGGPGPLSTADPVKDAAGDGPIRGAAAAANQPAATVELDEQVGALAPGTNGRVLAESVIALIGAELAAPGRDPAFPAYAAERLLGGLTPTGPTEVTATTDWVFFARRRTRTCAGQQPPPVRTRTYRLFHRRTDDRIRTPDDVLRGLNTARARASDLGFDPVATVDFVAGEVTLRSVAADLRTGWLAADRGSEIVLAGVGDFADSDGEAIALGRLATVRSVLADLADSTNARIEYLPDIPTEFHQPGLDGAMFTVGTIPVQTCVLVYRLHPDAFDRLLEVLRQSGDTISREQAIAQAEVQPDVFDVKLVNDEVVDPDSLRATWQGVAVLEGVLAVPSTSLADLATWRMRAGRVGDVIGLAAIDEQQITAQTEECGAILIVAITQ